MKSFKISTYNISSTRLTGKQKVTFAILADLHGLVFGKNHQTLYKAIIASQPDAVLVCGDLVVSRDTETLEAAAGLLLRICDQIPVFYALGNHEYKMLLNPETEIFYSNYEKLLTSAGICFLHNEHTSVQLKGNDFVFHGLELPVEYYHKPNSPALSLTAMEEMIGTPSQPGFHVLLAHNPKYGNTYFSWGADLILSGHNHGGVLRLDQNHGLTCPQYLLFPPFCCGEFKKGKQHMIVSAGLGEHTIPVRIHNPRELVLINLYPQSTKSVKVKINVFEGPLDLLLHLIEKNKIDIYDIPIVEITDQYMEYLHSMEQEDLGTMSEFMVMAATLLDIKCKMLLPKEVNEEGEEEDPREELVQKLLEYKMYKYMSYELKDYMDNAAGVFYKNPSIPDEVLKYREPVDPAELLAGLTLEKLNNIYQSILKKQESKIDPIRSKFGTIEKEEVSLSDKMLAMKSYAAEHRKFSFRQLLTSQSSRVQVIVTFLSILELMKMGYIHVQQDELFDDIQVDVTQDPETWTHLTEFADE